MEVQVLMVSLELVLLVLVSRLVSQSSYQLLCPTQSGITGASGAVGSSGFVKLDTPVSQVELPDSIPALNLEPLSSMLEAGSSGFAMADPPVS